MVHHLLVFVQKDLCWVDRWIRYCLVVPESESEFESEDDFWRLRFAAAPPPGLLKALLKRQVFFVAQFSWSPMIEDVRKTRIQRPQKSGRRPRRPRPRHEIPATCKTFVCFESWRHNRVSQFYCILTIDLFFSKLISFWEHFMEYI